MAFWYIDALDARAGMGLATYREADLDTHTIDLGKPAVFVGPPFFQGESVASRAIGFAATRGSFQLGLFVDGQEVAFDTLQGVCEFIRRVYISSGGGDTDSAISPAPLPPNPESGGEEFRDLPPDEIAIARDLLRFSRSLSEDVTSISQLKHSESWTRQLNRRKGKLSLLEILGSRLGADELLTYGSAVLVEEMILRFPYDHKLHGTWMKSIMSLGNMLRRLGLVHSLLESPDAHRLIQVASQTDRRFNLLNEYVRSLRAELQVMLGLGTYVYWDPGYALYRSGWHAGSDNTDALDDLSSFPIPSVAAHSVGLNPATASVRDLLSVFLAAPTVLEDKQSSGHEVTMIAAFVLLAGMLIVSAGKAYLAPMEGTRICDVLRENLLKEAILWMDAQMPAYLFHRDIEECIRGASGLRYGSIPTSAWVL
jgi:hypothetical protein